MTIQCCMCHKIEVAGEWTQSATTPNGLVSHTYCPVCYSRAQVAIRTEQARARARHELNLVGA
ncbi:MAG: hypothetical protein HZB26_18490 [Candidatus Hydrogenedentes bacterium]|nr:hypothetical protein [Candidatus Hydrogenedentota bacterium]